MARLVCVPMYMYILKTEKKQKLCETLHFLLGGISPIF